MTSPRNLFDRFDAIAREGRAALRSFGDDDRSLNARAIRDRSAAFARELRGSGIAPGDAVLIAGASGESFLIGILSIWSCDAAVIAADPQIPPAEMDRLRTTFCPRLVVTPRPDGSLGAEPSGGGAPPLPAGTSIVKLTSGSTGLPRGIAVSADQMIADGTRIVSGMGIGPDDLNLGAIPLSHSYGLGNLVMPLVIQGSPILWLRDPLPHLLARALETPDPLVFPGVPYLFELLARSDGPAFSPRGLKTCLSAGAPLRARTAAAFRERVGIPIRSFYGTSETGGIAFDASDAGCDAERWEGCVGTPLPGVEVSLEGEEGRVVVRSRSVASGYVGGDPGEDSGRFGERDFRTGDTGRLDGEGRLHLSGRVGSLVNISGRKVNPREVEQVLLAIPGISDAAVLGVPDESRGEALAACLVADRRVTPLAVREYLRKSLAPCKLPRRILFLESLPRNERGKIDEPALKREISRGT